MCSTRGPRSIDGNAVSVTLRVPIMLTATRPTRRGVRLRPSTWAAVAIVTIILICALFPDWIAPQDPYAQDIMVRLRPPVWAARGAEGYYLGTDELGRDVLSRVIYASRITLSISLLALAISSAIGLLAGLLGGYCGGMIDAVIVRLIDMQLAFPIILLVIAVTAVVGPSATTLVLVMGFSSWPQSARIVRAAVISVRGLEYVEAARSVGAGTARILARHIMPNILSPALVFATSELSRMILTESTLSFLGLGVQPPTPTWGGMITDAQPYITMSWSASLSPGIVLVLTILAFNMLGDALRDRFDPYRGKSR